MSATHYGVAAGFLFATIVFAFLAARFAATGAPLFRRFAAGLTGYALAFLAFSAVVALHPTDLDLATGLALLPLALGSLLLFGVGVAHWPVRPRRLVTVGAAGALLGIGFVRLFLFPSTPSFSAAGLIYLNSAPLITLFYVLILAAAVLPAVNVVAGRLTLRESAALTRLGFTLLVLSGVVLLVSSDDTLQLLNSGLMGAALLLLLAAARRPLRLS
jgi:hypothetical protein